MRAWKTMLLILHRGSDKMKQNGRVMVLDGTSAEKLYKRLRLIEFDEGSYKIAFEMKVIQLKTSYHLGIDG